MEPLPGMGGEDDPGFGLYVHWPFCASKCPYCDFNSHVRHSPPDEARFIAAFRREMAHYAGLTGKRRLSSVFFGGGTPSLMQPETLGAIVEAANRHWDFAPDIEITMEANPTSVDATRFAGYRSAGVNRVSLGVQALNDTDLQMLGRRHTVAEALAAVDVARRHFPRYSFDLIYARPAQSVAEWRDELKQAISHAAEHLSLYQLTVERGTAFQQLFDAGKLALPDADHSRALYDATQEVCEQHGLPAYEISNHARPGCESRHNLIYWRTGDFVGLGAGAHGRITQPHRRFVTAHEKMPEAWLEQVESTGSGCIETYDLVQSEISDEFLVMGLRLREGIDIARYEKIAGKTLDDSQIDFLIGHGFLERIGNSRLRATMSGFPVLDAVVADLAM